jgi:hypothetical protein
MGCQEHFHKAANQNFQKHLPNRRKHVQLWAKLLCYQYLLKNAKV